MPSISLAPRVGRGLAALAIAIAAFAVTTGTSAAPAGAQDAPDGSRSTITQQVVHREQPIQMCVEHGMTAIAAREARQ